MAQFFFHTQDRTVVRDEEGVDLPDVATARRAATIFAGELVKEFGEGLFESDLRLTVTNDAGKMMWDILVVAKEGTAATQ